MLILGHSECFQRKMDGLRSSPVMGTEKYFLKIKSINSTTLKSSELHNKGRRSNASAAFH